MRQPRRMRRSNASVLLAVAIGLAAIPRSAALATEEAIPIDVVGGRILVHVDPGGLPVPREILVAWITTAGRAVASYYGRFPVRQAEIQVLTGTPGKISQGHTADGHALIRLAVGRDTTAEDFSRDWVMTHEMVHLAHPSLEEDYAWFAEGVATYVEPIARVQVGALEADEVWKWLLFGLPKGLPGSGDRGLDHTHTWGRTYWGGALYCLLADLEIREQTANRRSLADALRGIVAAGGNVESGWTLARTLAVADQALGENLHVLSELHRNMGERPFAVNLEDLLRRLGVAYVDGRIVYDDQAPLASIRRSITRSSSTRRALAAPARRRR